MRRTSAHDAALPRADGRFHADRAAAREQHRAGRHPGFAAVCGGGQSLHTNGFDEAQALPTERSATIALRTQQILATEAGSTNTADPLGGSYYIESLTSELAGRARALIAEIDEMGGAVAAVESGWVQGQIEQAAFEHHRRVQSGEEVIVGVNRWTEESEQPIQLHTIDPEAERRQVERTQASARPPRRGGGRVGAGSSGERGAGRGQPAAADARGASSGCDDRRGLPGAARRVGHLRRPARASVRTTGARLQSGTPEPNARP